MSIYMQISGVIGSATDENHQGWIELDGVNFNAKRRVVNKIGSRTLRDVAVPNIGSMTITKMVDKSSPYLLQQMLKGKAFPQVQINICRTGNSGNTPYTKYILSNVLISSYEESNLASGGDVGQEYLELSFTQLQKTFIPDYANGDIGSPISTGYNLGTAKAL